MPSDRREQIRNEILVQTYGYRPQARDAERLARTARLEGELADATAAEFAIEAAYLADKALLRAARDPTARAHLRYAITAAGIEFAEERGIV